MHKPHAIHCKYYFKSFKILHGYNSNIFKFRSTTERMNGISCVWGYKKHEFCTKWETTERWILKRDHFFHFLDHFLVEM
jgi:hypothetical protein